MQSKKFQKKIEDFVCEKCGKQVKGGGYTDHCPACLWSKHVDVNPGDRSSGCHGLMRPVRAEPRRHGYMIYYRCLKCGFEHRVRSFEEDDIEEIIKLTAS